jgi:hypothetical protein
MKLLKCSLFLFFIVSTVSASLAQPNIAVDSTRWRDEDLYTGDESHTIPPYNWIGGGFVAGGLFADLSSLNKNIAQPFIHQDLPTTVVMLGGQGFIPFPWVKNLVIGGVGMSGRSQVCCVPDTASTGQPVMRTLRYSVGYGGISLDYSLPVNISRCHILAGMEFGFGEVSIYAKQAYDRPSFDIGAEFDQPSVNITHTYSAGMFVYKPQITFEWAPLSFMMFKASVAYQGSSVSTWKADEDVGLGTTDKLGSINGSGLMVNAGIYLGFFQ